MNKFKEFMWSLPGNEVWIVRNSPTDHNYYFGQGLLFTMTFFFAAFCGFFAGMDFSDKWYVAIIFGLIWGLLVYSIDRMMVQTIDKVHIDKTYSGGKGGMKKFTLYFLPRFFWVLFWLYLCQVR